jgi:hypothetical protein
MEELKTVLLNVFSDYLQELEEKNKFNNEIYTEDNLNIVREYLQTIDIKIPTDEVLSNSVSFWYHKGKFPTFDEICENIMNLCGCPYVVMGFSDEIKELYKQFIAKSIKDGQGLSCDTIRYTFMYYNIERRLPSYDELRNYIANTIRMAQINFMDEPEDKNWKPCKSLDDIKNKYTYKCTTESADNCTICLEKIKNGEDMIKLPCSHIFHLGKNKDDENDFCEGIIAWLSKNNTCPVCKTQYN